MKKVIIVLLLIFIINKALAGHVGFSNDENLLIYIPVLFLIIWWIVKIIRKNYFIYKSEVAEKFQEQEGKSSSVNEQININNEIPEFYLEKDVFGLDKPSVNVNINTALSDTKPDNLNLA